MPQQSARRAVKGEHRLMREVNRSLILDLLREGSTMSRVQIARRTSLSKPTVSAIIEDLIREGIILEHGLGPPAERGGRPPELLSFNQSAEAVAGIHFGVHTTHLAVADGLGTIVHRIDSPVTSTGPAASLRDAAALLRRGLAEAEVKRDRLRAVGVAIPGLIEAASGRVVLAPNLRWTDVSMRTLSRRAFGVPTSVLNLTAAAALAEATQGAARGSANFVWIYLGTGVGSAIVIDGRLYGGRAGFAGELGHWQMVEDGPVCNCGRRGCLEVVAGTSAIVRAAHVAVEAKESSTLRAGAGIGDVMAAATEGDALARRLLEDSARTLGRAVAYVANLLNPELVVLGGPLLGAGDLYVDAVRVAAEDHALVASAVKIVPSSLGPSAPLLGAVHAAFESISPSVRIVGA